jgi:hypothetical protein
MPLTARDTLAAVGSFLLLFVSSTARGAEGPSACMSAYEDTQLLRRNGKLLEARDAALVCSRASCPDVARTDCAAWAGEIQREIPSVAVVAQDAYYTDEHGARVIVDGIERAAAASGRAFELNPGEHVFRVERLGYEPMERTVVIVQGERDRILRFPLHALAPSPPATSPAPPAAFAPRRQATYLPALVAAGASAVTLGVAAWLGLTGRSDLSQLHTTCAPDCSDAQVDPVRRKLVASDIVLGVGILGTALSAYLFLRPPSTAEPVPPRVGVAFAAGPGAGASLSIRGAL